MADRIQLPKGPDAQDWIRVGRAGVATNRQSSSVSRRLWTSGHGLGGSDGSPLNRTWRSVGSDYLIVIENSCVQKLTAGVGSHHLLRRHIVNDNQIHATKVSEWEARKKARSRQIAKLEKLSCKERRAPTSEELETVRQLQADQDADRFPS